MAGGGVRDVSVIDAVGYALFFGGFFVAVNLRAPWYVAIGLPVLGTAVLIVAAELRRRRRH